MCSVVAVGGIVRKQEMFGDLHEMCFIQWSQDLLRWVCLVFRGFVPHLDNSEGDKRHTSLVQRREFILIIYWTTYF